MRETVPDSILDLAEEIEVVDLSPADLIKRLKEGKVDLSGHPGSAAHSFFSERNLTGLRQLALQRAEKPPARRNLFRARGLSLGSSDQRSACCFEIHNR